MPRITKPAPMPKKSITCKCGNKTDAPYRKHVIVNDYGANHYEAKTPRANMNNVREYFFCSYSCSVEYPPSHNDALWD